MPSYHQENYQIGDLIRHKDDIDGKYFLGMITKFEYGIMTVFVVRYKGFEDGRPFTWTTYPNSTHLKFDETGLGKFYVKANNLMDPKELLVLRIKHGS